jgi:hypothetical protein
VHQKIDDIGGERLIAEQGGPEHRGTPRIWSPRRRSGGGELGQPGVADPLQGVQAGLRVGAAVTHIRPARARSRFSQPAAASWPVPGWVAPVWPGSATT